jgi:uncharacterized membrane protein
MKTKLTSLGVISPFISFAQMGGGGGGEIISVLIVLAITVGLFLLLRSVMLLESRYCSKESSRNQQITELYCG